MEFHPPLEERSDKELFDIISNKDKWTEEIQLFAKQELLKRNFTSVANTKERNRRTKIIHDYNERQKKILEKNRTESYTIGEMVLIISLPFNILLGAILQYDPLEAFWDLDAKNYKKKIWQRVVLIIISVFVWYYVIRLIAGF